MLIAGPAGDIEVLVKGEDFKGIAIICHPHPLHEGTLNNKVVYTLAKAFERKGLQTVRFNFRGVGLSQGVFDYGQGEIEDCLAVLKWAKETYPNIAHKIYLAGFSFGAYIAARVAQSEPAIQQLFTIAPAVGKNDYSDYTTIKSIACPWVIILGDQDEIVSSQAVIDWHNHLKQDLNFQTQLIMLPGASHFFHGKLIELQHLVEQNFYDPSA